MWSLKVLSGPLTGQEIKLRSGENSVGRHPENSIPIKSGGVSKHHCKFMVNGNSVSVSDLGSSNGTFVNGMRVQNCILQLGDRIGIHENLVELQYQIAPNMGMGGNANMGSSAEWSGSAAPDMHANPGFAAEEIHDPIQMNADGPQLDSITKPPENIKETIDQYVEKVMLPGVYKLAEIFEFRMVIFGMLITLILSITLLSVIPMIQITQDTIIKESSRRAVSIARSLVKVNQSILQRGMKSQLTTSFAEKEDGVLAALIINAEDGSVIAPANRIGAYKNLPFIHSARKKGEEHIKKISDDQVGASIPIRTYDASSGSYEISSYAVVLYSLGNLAMDDGRAISLFIQTLGMALIVGFIFYFFIFKLAERPYQYLNRQIDLANKGEIMSIEPEFNMPVMKPLITNINNLVNQVANSSGNDDGPMSFTDRSFEVENLVKVIGQACMVIDIDKKILAMNSAAEEITNESASSLVGSSTEAILDESLKLNLDDLLDRVVAESHMIQSNTLEFNGLEMDVDAQAIGGSEGIEYILVCINEKGGF
ncbi:MAG: FHA domain-containing protein [Bdellovibrionales bacterium]